MFELPFTVFVVLINAFICE